MPEVKFQLVDMVTWKTPGNRQFQADKKARSRLLRKACYLLEGVSPVKPKELQVPGVHFLVVLANGQPVSALYYGRTRDRRTGRPKVDFYHANLAKRSVNFQFARKTGETPARALFRWMRTKVGGAAIVTSGSFTTEGKRFITKLVRDGVLRQFGRTPWRSFVFTGKRWLRRRR